MPSRKETVKGLPYFVNYRTPRRLQLPSGLWSALRTVAPDESNAFITSSILRLGYLFNPWPNLWGEWGRQE